MFVSVTNRAGFPSGRAICRRGVPPVFGPERQDGATRPPLTELEEESKHSRLLRLLLSPELFTRLRNCCISVRPPKELPPFQNSKRGCGGWFLKTPPGAVISQYDADAGSIFDLPEQPVAALVFLIFTFPAAALTNCRQVLVPISTTSLT